MAFKIASNEIASPQRGRQAELDLDLMQDLNGMIGDASFKQPLVSDQTFSTRDESNKAASKLARQLDKFRDDARTRVATRSFVVNKTDPASWNPEDDQWSFGLYIAEPIKRNK